MPRYKRSIPKKLPEKLKKIRLDSGLRQYELRQIICPNKGSDKYSNSPISDFEQGNRQPSLQELLRYARFGKVTTDFLIDDELDEFAAPHPN